MANYIPRDSAQANLPLTPPDSGSGYAYTSMHYPQDPYAARSAHRHHHRNQHQDHAYDYQQQQQQQSQHNYIPALPAYSAAYHQQPIYQSVPTTLPSISSYYEPVGAPILPPIRVQDAVYDEQYDYQRDSRPVKEEKATGGVSAKLDYDMDRMTDFVVSTTQHMYDLHLSGICLADIDITRSFQQSISSPPAFRKWVYQVLSATRLPSATILLSLHYLSDRLKVFPNSVPSGENQIYRMLSVALILGSKFLDDNTFINRSWSDVTAIKVSELNLLELKWLRLIEYNLHVEASCVKTWTELWTKFDTERSRMRLSPLDTDMARRHDTSRSHYSPYPTPYSSTATSHRSFDSPARSSFYTPHSAVDPWNSNSSYASGDYWKRHGTANRYPTLNDIDDANRRAENFQSRYPQSYQAYQNLAGVGHYSAAAAPGYVPWDHYQWNNVHRPDCTCSNCSYRAWRPYNYNIGTVMG